jgi:hypothetical protein
MKYKYKQICSLTRSLFEYKMSIIVTAFLFITLVESQTNAESLLFLPEHMLPPPGITYALAYDLVMATLRIPSVYVVQAVLAPDSTTVIGYRNWYQSEYGATYIVSLKNGTYLQANVDLNTRKCINVLDETVNCAGWTSVETLKYDNWCQIRPVDKQFISQRTLSMQSSMINPKLPVSVTDATATVGIPGKITLTYQFTSKNEQASFPDIKCYF